MVSPPRYTCRLQLLARLVELDGTCLQHAKLGQILQMRASQGILQHHRYEEPGPLPLAPVLQPSAVAYDPTHPVTQ